MIPYFVVYLICYESNMKRVKSLFKI